MTFMGGLWRVEEEREEQRHGGCEVRGLRARGNFEVDMSWRDGKLVEASIHSLNGGSAKLRNGPVTREVKLNKGETYQWNGQ